MLGKCFDVSSNKNTICLFLWVYHGKCVDTGNKNCQHHYEKDHYFSKASDKLEAFIIDYYLGQDI